MLEGGHQISHKGKQRQEMSGEAGIHAEVGLVCGSVNMADTFVGDTALSLVHGDSAHRPSGNMPFADDAVPFPLSLRLALSVPLVDVCFA